MDAIKKKMQGMKLEKENALERAAHNEQMAKDANLRAEKNEEEARALQKKIQTIENDLDQTGEQLTQINAKLEEKEKALQTVSTFGDVSGVSLVAESEGAFVSRNCGETRGSQLNVGAVYEVPKSEKFRQFHQHGCFSKYVFVSCLKNMSQRGGPGSTKKRGHQHHPRNNGSRRRAALEPSFLRGSSDVQLKQQQTPGVQQSTPEVVPVILSASSTSNKEVDQGKSDIIDLTNCDDDDLVDSKQSKLTSHKNDTSKNGSFSHMSLIDRPAAEGSSQSDQEAEDAEVEELSRLRCTSERTEVVAEREARRKRRCADYPGLAFGSSIFSSDTLMKFSIIRNELHNIMNTQLKRVR
ncbi:uncharacterized protein LOC116162420 [Photinus pyralis]|uniref:uncharacterized protein LOC116162420 n=1 Tax=Photinus pyralis TaxID=7054 RepID=UPI00126718CC|nr:uncharacterized protein LOC116162420 [Photinus pyralis]